MHHCNSIRWRAPQTASSFKQYPHLACLLFTSVAWKMADRDQWIGWADAIRKTNLPLLVNNSRFLILPWCAFPTDLLVGWKPVFAHQRTWNRACRLHAGC
ncbi:MAG: Druantia anti-phage system protein DruA [Bryobacteraceae bacterium]